MKKLLVFLCLLVCCAVAYPQQKVLIRFTNPETDLVKHFIQNNYDIVRNLPGEYIDLLTTDKEYTRLQSEGFKAEIIQTEAEMIANLRGTDAIPGYRTYQQALAELQQLESDYPDICKLYDIGDSFGKIYFDQGNNNYVNYQHDIWALKVTANVSADEDKPAFYYMGAHHAREPVSVEVVFHILNHILDNYGSDPGITASVNSKELWFIPIVNPDGHKIVLDEIDISWRKNIRDNDSNGQISWKSGWNYPDGVDPNRNYGWEWGGQGASANSNDQTYRGPEEFSEPEIQVMRDLMAQRHFVAGISYHSYSELVLWPFGYIANAYGPDSDALAALGTAMAQSIPKLGSGHYTPGPTWSLYPASGNTDDYAYGKHGIFSYCIELGTQFIPSYAQALQICQDNLEGALILMNRIDFSALTGIVTEASTGQPVVADIYVEGIDNTGLPREPYRSNEMFGRYFRMLPNGNYTVTISSFGYISQTFDNINIHDAGQTILNVALTQSQIIDISGTITDADTGQPIENAMIEIMDTPLEPAFTNNEGAYFIEEVSEDSYLFKVTADNYTPFMQTIMVTQQNSVINFQLTESNAVSFESGVFPSGWSFAGNANWYIDNGNAWDGDHSARSGAIGHNQSSQMIVALEDATAGVVSFYRKVSSENNYDFLKFYINDVLMGQWSGEQDWAELSYPVSAGNFTFKWEYMKDGSVTSGQDCAWIDYIMLPPSVTVVADFIAEPLTGTAPLEVQFTNLSSENAQLWEWDFNNDGTVDSYEQHPVWIYSNPGAHTVKLTVTANSKAEATETKSEYITVTVPDNYFTPVWTSPFNPMTIYVVEAELDGVDLNVWDEIGIFDIDPNSGEEICVGTGVLSEPLINGTYLEMIASMDDGSLSGFANGFTPGNTMIFRFYTQANGEVLSVVPAFPYTGYDEVFTSQGAAIVSLHGEIISGASQILQLQAGWNGISSFLLPDDLSIENILTLIEDELVIIQNLSGFYWPQGDVNTLTNWDYTSGYQLKLAAPQTLNIEGIQIPEKTITLQQGWNLMPVLSEELTAIEDLFGASLQHVIIIKEAVGMGIFWPDMNVANFSQLQPGSAYLIKVSQPVTITFY
jgi:carboxypeptidase T